MVAGTLGGMEIAEYVEILRSEGRLLLAAAERAGSDAPVPSCPGWQVRDLLRHTGRIHRWAERYVSSGSDRPVRPSEAPDLDGAALVEWVHAGHAALVAALEAAPADLTCWTFLPAPSPLAFWARRQAHETAVHRVDAEAALGEGPAPVAAAFAADGIDELLTGFHARDRSRVRTTSPKTLAVRTTDAPDASGPGDAAWLVHLSDAPPRTERVRAAKDEPERAGGGGGRPSPDCVVEGPAAALYLTLWNRRTMPPGSPTAPGIPERDGAGPVAVRGDASLARLWQEASGV